LIGARNSNIWIGARNSNIWIAYHGHNVESDGDDCLTTILQQCMAGNLQRAQQGSAKQWTICCVTRSVVVNIDLA
jgi:hypothetical protein